MRLSEAVAAHVGAAPVLRIMRGTVEVWSPSLDGTMRVPVFAAAAGMLAPTVIVTYTVTPTELSASAAVHTPTVSTDLAALLPVGFMASAALHPPTVSVGASVAPSPFAAIAGMLPPVTTSNLVVEAIPLTAGAQFATPEVSAGVNVSAGPLAAAAVFPAPTVTTGLVVQPAPFGAVAQLTAPTVAAGVEVASAPMTAAAGFVAPTVTSGLLVQAAPFAATAQLAAPTVTSGAGVAPAALAATAGMPTPTVASGIVVAPPALAASAALRTPVMSVGYGAAPAAMAASAALAAPVAGMGVNITVPAPMTATAQGIVPDSIAATTTITGGAPFGATAQMLTPGVSTSGGTIDLAPPTMTATAAALAPAVSTAPVTPWLNYVTINTPRNATTTHTVTPSSGTVTAGTLFTPTAGRRLVCVVEGAVTSTTPSGWTLPTNGDAIQNTGLYVWHRVAAGSDSLTTTHNAANYPAVFHFFEFPSTATFVACVKAVGVAYAAAGPNLTGLTGTNHLFGVAAVGLGGSGTTGGYVWTGTPTPTELVDVLVPWVGGGVDTDGYLFGLAYVANSTATSFQPTATATTPASAAPNKECLTFAISA